MFRAALARREGGRGEEGVRRGGRRGGREEGEGEGVRREVRMGRVLAFSPSDVLTWKHQCRVSRITS